MSGFWHTLRSFFDGNRSGAAAYPEVERLFAALKGLILRQDLAEDYFKSYQKLKEVSWQAQEALCIKLYFSLEKFIAANGPPIVAEKYTPEGIREAVRRSTAVSELPVSLRLIFLPDLEQTVYLLDRGVRPLLDQLTRQLGFAQTKMILAGPDVSAQFLKLFDADSRLRPEAVSEAARTATLAEINHSFRIWYKTAYDRIKEFGGVEAASQTMERSFAAIQPYSPELAAKYFDVVPPGVLDKQHLSFLSREELERQVQEKTAQLTKTLEELSEAKKSVEAQVVARTKELREEQARLVASIHSIPLGCIIAHEETIILRNQLVGTILDIQEDTSLAQIKARFNSFDMGAKIAESLSEHKLVVLPKIQLLNKYLKILISPISLLGSPQEVIGAIILIEDITEATLLDQAKQDFLALASHEMRTPLTIIQGNAELIEGLVPATSNDVLKNRVITIEKNTERLLRIVNDFLDVTQLEQGKIQMKKEAVDLAEMAKELVTEMTAAAAEKGLTLALEAASGSAIASADKDRTHEVLMNLIANAIHHTSQGGITLAVEQDGKAVRVRVKDTGSGIDPSLQSALFKKFSTVTKDFMHSTEYGSGLGLYIAKLLIEGMGGTIALERSMPGVGSVFMVSLPKAG